MTAILRVDRELCIGAGNCVRLAPRAFQLDEEGVAIIADPSAATLETLRRAARSCPAGAIEVAAGP